MKKIALILLIIFFAQATGCALFRAFTPPEIVKHPDAPMQILEAKGDYLRVAVYDRLNNRMIEYGWIEIIEYKAWTLTKYDWEAFIVRRGGTP